MGSLNRQALEEMSDLPLGMYTGVIKRAQIKPAKSTGVDMLALHIKCAEGNEWVNMPLETTAFKIAELMEQLGELDCEPEDLIGQTVRFWKFEESGGEVYTRFKDPDAEAEEAKAA